MSNQFILIPGTNTKVYEGTVVILNRLPNLKWIIHNGPYFYNGKRQKGWYLASIPSDTTMPLFNEDLVNMVIEDDPSHSCPCPPGPGPYPPYPPCPPGPGPYPPAPVPIPFTPKDKRHLESAMLTVDTLRDRDMLGHNFLQNGKIVKVNDIDGHGTIEYYSWCAATCEWQLASLGYRYMTREEIEQAIGSSIVDIAWSDGRGSLVVTDNNADTDYVQLTNVAHDISYTTEDTTIRIPMYGKDDLIINIPADQRISAIRFEKEWVFPDGSVKPAIVATVTDGHTSQDIAGDATDLYNIYEGAETATAIVLISSENSKVTAEVKLSSIANNAIEVDNEGLLVDLSGYVDRKPIDRSVLLVADGEGGFTYAGTDGITIDTTIAISDLTDPDKKVVTANLIADAINAAITSISQEFEERLNEITQLVDDIAAQVNEMSDQISDMSDTVNDIEDRIDFGAGADGEVILTDNDGFARSGKTIGGDELPEEPVANRLATEEAIVKAISWRLD